MCSHRSHLAPPASLYRRSCDVVELSPCAWHINGVTFLCNCRICFLLQLLMVMTYRILEVKIRSCMSFLPTRPIFLPADDADHLTYLVCLTICYAYGSLQLPRTSGYRHYRCLYCNLSCNLICSRNALAGKVESGTGKLHIE